MPLEYPDEWKFDGVGEVVPQPAISEFHDLLLKIATGGPERWQMLERFKAAFGRSGYSSDASWAETDLHSAMTTYGENAVQFIDSLWQGIEAVKGRVPVPSAATINKILKRHAIPLFVDPPKLELRRGDVTVVHSAEEGTDSEVETGHVYIRGEELGRGGYGIVYKVIRRTAVADFEFAMKVLDPSPFNENAQRSFARFQREIAILRQLQHRAIIHYIEAGVDRDGKPYVLMPVIQGRDLRRALAGRDLPAVLLAFREILSGLAYAHSRGVVHRDLKPSNVLVRTSDNQPIILDFGCAYMLDGADNSSLTTTLIGSMGYIPQEVINNPKLRTPLHDVYACGVMLYEVLAGVRPDPMEYEPLAAMQKDLRPLDPIVRAAIAPASSRIESAAAFVELLQNL